MTPQSFSTWVQRKQRGDRQHVFAADRIVPMVAQSGERGMTRAQIGHAASLEPRILDELLNGMVGCGLLTVTDEAGIQVYRSRQGMI